MTSRANTEKNSVSDTMLMPEGGERAFDPIRHIAGSKIILAPMSDITDPPFRLIARKYGCRFAFTEMIDANAIFYNNRKTSEMLDSMPADWPLGAQVVGDDEKKMLFAAKRFEEKGFPLLDINAGCPARKVTKAGKGSALLKEPVKLGKIVGLLVRNLSIPVTVKIRSGWDLASRNYLEVAKIIEEEGARAITVHSRTQAEMYKGKPDHNVVREIKERATIPVLASGNIFSPEDIKNVLDFTGCDAVTVARGALGNPWIFNDYYAYMQGLPRAGARAFDDIKNVVREHYDLAFMFYEERRVFPRMYKHLAWYLNRYKNLNAIMTEYRKVKSPARLADFLNALAIDERNRLLLKQGTWGDTCRG